MPLRTIAPPTERLQQIERARQLALHSGEAARSAQIEPWIARSWQRCLDLGLAPTQRVAFDAVSAVATRRAEEANRSLVQAARPVLQGLSRAMLDTRYFAILTNAQGVVVDALGPIDRSDRRMDLITRIGVDLSEQAVGTTAISAALTELAPVWLHRGEHFFDDTSVYSCAGAPLFGPDGTCIGMLDLTGVMAAERPELRHLVVHAARNIENSLVLGQAHSLLLRLNWPGNALGTDSDGLLGLDADGFVCSANRVARELLPELQQSPAQGWHCRDLFALAFEQFFDAARHVAAATEVPLWSGLRLQVLARAAYGPAATRHLASSDLATVQPPRAAPVPLKDLQSALIRQAVADAKGNVAQAAKTLGISRATVYRKLQSAPR